MAVTIEPAGGVPAPTGAMYLVGKPAHDFKHSPPDDPPEPSFVRRRLWRCYVRKLAYAAMAFIVAIPFTTLDQGLEPPRGAAHQPGSACGQHGRVRVRESRAPDRVVLISNFIPLQFPSSGPNFWKFDDNVLYEIMIDNTGDAVEDITYQFQFRTEIRNPNTFLYNTGPVSSLDDPDLNVRQFYNLTRVVGPRRTGSSTLLAANLPVLPANVGLSSIRDYNGQLGSGVHAVIPHDLRVFAGPREEGFYVDLGATFDLLQLRTLVNGLGAPIDSLAGFNVHTVAIELPISAVTRNGMRPASASDPNATIGVWSTASRRSTTTRNAMGQSQAGDWVQVSRLGNPLVNEVGDSRRHQGRVQRAGTDRRRRGAQLRDQSRAAAG